MADSIEAQGVTIEEAIQVALNRLGVSRERVEIEILHHPRSGLLGIGARRAKVRATLRETHLADGEEFQIGSDARRRRGRRGRRPGRGAAGQGRAAGESEENRQGRGSGARGGQQRQGRGGRARTGEQANVREDGADHGKDERQATGNPRRGRPPGKDGGRTAERPRRAQSVEAGPETGTEAPSGTPEPVTAQPGHAEAEVVSEDNRAASALTVEMVGERAKEIVSELLRRMGFESQVELGASDQVGEVVVAIRCDADGLLIGRHGQTLDAAEHLVNRMVLAGETSELRVVLDVGGYRDRRRDSLLELADRLKVRALTQGRRVQVSPMSPRDRRMFQGALAGDDTVTTRVLGAGFYRRVMIVPVGLEDDDSPVEEIGHEPGHVANRQNEPGESA